MTENVKNEHRVKHKKNYYYTERLQASVILPTTVEILKKTAQGLKKRPGRENMKYLPSSTEDSLKPFTSCTKCFTVMY